jgi:adenylate cyclase
LGNKLPLEFNSLGEKQVKNISTPIRVYSVRLAPGAKLPDPHGSTRRASGKVFVAAATIAVVALAASLAWFRLAPDSQAPGSNEDSVAESSSKPVVAVLPLDNLSGDPEQQYFSDGVSDDIITDLSRLSGISVIARNTSFSYRDSGLSLEEIADKMAATHVLSGSIRRQGDNVRVNVALIDTSGGVQLWADRFDRSLDDIFAVQSEISGSVAKALSIELTGDEKNHFQSKATNDFVAYDLFLKGQQLYRSGNRTAMLETKAAYQKAIERDPGFARAYGALGVAIMREVVRGWSPWPAEAKDRALSLAEKAVSLDPHSQHVYWALGFVHLYRGEHDAALEAAKRAVELAPSYGDGYGLLALVSNWMGESESAIRYAREGIALNPNFTWDYPYNIGRAKYQLGEHEEAERYLLDALKRNPAALPAQLYLIANYASAGNLEDAEWQVMQLGVTNPEVTVSHVAEYYPFGSQTLRDAMLGDLKTAGLPE